MNNLMTTIDALVEIAWGVASISAAVALIIIIVVMVIRYISE